MGAGLVSEHIALYLEDKDKDEWALLRVVIMVADSKDERQKCCLICHHLFS